MRIRNRIHIHFRSPAFLLLVSLLVLISSSGAVSQGWQPVNVTSWAQVDLPPGWTIQVIDSAGSDPDSATLRAVSPDQETTLEYLFERDLNPASAGELKRSQDRMMNARGFCECQDQPRFSETDRGTVMKQTYYKGTDQGAVVCSGAYPGWGRYQYFLIMNGKSAVRKYYEDLPDTLAEHIRPVSSPEIPNNDSVSG